MQRIDQGRHAGQRNAIFDQPAAEAIDQIGFGRPSQTGLGHPFGKFQNLPVVHRHTAPPLNMPLDLLRK